MERSALEQLQVIIEDAKKLLDHSLDFQAFVIISIGIEYLGAFTDSKDISEYSESANRFNNGLDFFKNLKYKNNKTLLFKQLRGPLIHQYRPGDKIVLSSKKVNGMPLEDHLKKDENDRIILIAEQLIIDFEEAIARFQNAQESLNKDKMNKKHLIIQNVQSPSTNEVYPASGNPISIIERK